jgi:hypothetical protein
VAEFFIRIWHALTAAGRMFALGSFEAAGFWSTTLLLLGAFIFSMEIAGGVTWRMIEGRLKPKMRDKENEAALRRVIHDLKAELYDIQVERALLTAKNAELSRVIAVERSFNRNWNADAHKVTGAEGHRDGRA